MVVTINECNGSILTIILHIDLWETRQLEIPLAKLNLEPEGKRVGVMNIK